MTGEEEDNDPDVFDLMGWVIEFHPKVWDAIRYLHAEPLRKCALVLWREAGKPEICEVL